LCHLSDFNACDDFQLCGLITHMLRISCKDVELDSISNYILVDFIYYQFEFKVHIKVPVATIHISLDTLITKNIPFNSNKSTN
jgi:hypothetical protein